MLNWCAFSRLVGVPGRSVLNFKKKYVYYAESQSSPYIIDKGNLMNLPDTIGLIAGFLTSTGFLPQLLKALKTKSTKDISAPMLLILAAGVILWIVYGVMVSALPVIIANVLSLTFISSILILKVKYQ